MEWVQLTIDGQDHWVPHNISILEACKRIGISIPALCYDPELKLSGSCRLCVVEIGQSGELVSSCSTMVEQGMTVRTESVRVRDTRKTILELLAANHPLECENCPKSGTCLFEKYVLEYEVTGNLFSISWSTQAIDESTPFILRNPNKCILCTKCVRVCNEVQGRKALTLVRDRIEYNPSTSISSIHLNYDREACVFCGSCVSVCPAGGVMEKERFYKGLLWTGTKQKEITKVPTTCPYCGTGCNFDLNVKDGKVIGVTSNPDSPVNGRALCVKGRFGIDDLIHNPERLTTPLIRETKDGDFREASWDEALELVSRKLHETKETYGPDSIAALSSAHCTNEENYLMQKLMRAGIGTNNVDHCART